MFTVASKPRFHSESTAMLLPLSVLYEGPIFQSLSFHIRDTFIRLHARSSLGSALPQLNQIMGVHGCWSSTNILIFSFRSEEKWICVVERFCVVVCGVHKARCVLLRLGLHLLLLDRHNGAHYIAINWARFLSLPLSSPCGFSFVSNWQHTAGQAQ